jgi:hypothetical protein
MCVKLCKNDETYEYDFSKPLLNQIDGCTDILIKYEPDDENIRHFLQEIQHCAKIGVNPNVKIRVEYSNFLMGFKTKNEIKTALNDINLNEVIKLLVLMQRDTDQKLAEMSNICANRECNGK